MPHIRRVASNLQIINRDGNLDMDVNADEENSLNLSQYHWGWSLVIALITIITVALRYALPFRDGDVWWHMLYGKYFLDHNTLIADHTIFSWTPSTNDTIYCTWLPDIILYLLHKTAGLAGLFAFQYFGFLFFILACFLFAHRLGLATNPFVWFLVLNGVLMAYLAAFPKPELCSFMLMTALVGNWYYIRFQGNNSHLCCYCLPIIILIWVNSHGAFIFGLIFLFCAALGELMNSRWSYGNVLPAKIRYHLWIGLGISVLMPFLNPYGWKYPYQLFFDLLPTKENLQYNQKIAAYNGTFSADVPFHSFAIYGNISVIVIVGLSLFLMKKRKIDWSVLVPNITFFYLYTMYYRTTFYLVPVSFFSSVLMLDILRRSSVISCRPIIRKTLPLIVLAICVLLSLSALYKAYSYAEVGSLPGNFDIVSPNAVDEAEYIKKYFPEKKIGNTYNVGAYLLWELWPNNKIFFDSRHFPYKNWSNEYFAFRYGIGLSAFLKKYPCDIWCVDYSDSIISSALMNSGQWQLAFYGRTGAVYVSKKIPLPGNGKYMVSPNIRDIKSYLIAHQVFLFAITIYDWQTAEKMISVMDGQYLADKKTIISKHETLLAGFKAFARQDYNSAINLLKKFNNSIVGIGAYIVTSHLHLAQISLNAEDYSQALTHVKAAFQLLPDAAYTSYNLGLVEYLQSKESQISNQYVKKEPTWKRHFRMFLDRINNDVFFKKEIDFSRQVLSGNEIDLKKEERQMLIPELTHLR